MNKGIYKTIYSSTVQQTVAVWEYARGKDKSHSGGARTRGCRIRLLPVCIALAAGICPQPLWAESAISEDDRAPAHERPVILINGEWPAAN